MRRYFSIEITLAFVIFLAGSSNLFAAANDDFASGIGLTGTNLTVVGSNSDATKQAGEPNHAGNPGGQSVWWIWTPPADGDVTIKTDGSSFDTLLAVYLGTDLAMLTLVATNDDHGRQLTSRVRFSVLAGSQYRIAVDGFNGDFGVASGDITLTLDFVSGPFLRPPHDHYRNRLVLAESFVVTHGSNSFATREPDEPQHAGASGDTSVWWSWTATASGPVTITTKGSTFDTVLAVYAGTSLSALTQLGSNDDADSANGVLTSVVTIDATAGETLRIAVDGFDGASGEITLQIRPLIVRLAAPVRLPDGSFQFTLNTVPGTTNEIQTSPDLRSWTVIATLITPNGTAIFTNLAHRNLDRSFYRVRLTP